jgi:hypothetical protein
MSSLTAGTTERVPQPEETLASLNVGSGYFDGDIYKKTSESNLPLKK